jgi:hypothetical protein
VEPENTLLRGGEIQGIVVLLDAVHPGMTDKMIGIGRDLGGAGCKKEEEGADEINYSSHAGSGIGMIDITGIYFGGCIGHQWYA